MTDPLSDMIVRIKNGLQIQKDEIFIPFSKIKEETAKILKEKGFIDSYKKIQKGKREFLVLSLKYKNNLSAISEIKRISKPGRRFYIDTKEIPKLTKGFGVLILSTSKGIMADEEAKKIGIGGEVILRVW